MIIRYESGNLWPKPHKKDNQIQLGSFKFGLLPMGNQVGFTFIIVSITNEFNQKKEESKPLIWSLHKPMFININLPSTPEKRTAWLMKLYVSK